jgi:predicted regulator of Ras-like GTPase activity (Roadblock/LC7/MglB family)
MPDYASYLETLTRIQGIRGAMVVAMGDGLVVAAKLMEDVRSQPLAAMAASLAARTGELSERSGFGAPRFLQLQCAGGVLLAAPAGPDLVLAAVAGREAAIGLARLEMRRVAERLA